MKKNGFTLVELLAVIGLISIIIVIAVPVITNLRKNAIEKEKESQIKEIETAAILYIQDEKINTESITVKDLINHEYLKPNNTGNNCENEKGCLFDPYGNNLTNKSITITKSNNKVNAKYQE